MFVKNSTGCENNSKKFTVDNDVVTRPQNRTFSKKISEAHAFFLLHVLERPDGCNSQA